MERGLRFLLYFTAVVVGVSCQSPNYGSFLPGSQFNNNNNPYEFIGSKNSDRSPAQSLFSSDSGQNIVNQGFAERLYFDGDSFKRPTSDLTTNQQNFQSGFQESPAFTVASPNFQQKSYYQQGRNQDEQMTTPSENSPPPESNEKQNTMVRPNQYEFIGSKNSDPSPSQSLFSSDSGQNIVNQGFAEGLYFDEDSFKRPTSDHTRPTSELTTNQQNFQSGLQESPAFTVASPNFQEDSFYPPGRIQDVGIEQLPTPSVNWPPPESNPSVSLAPSNQPQQRTMVLPDGKKVQMTNENARMYPHGMFQGAKMPQFTHNY